MMNDQEKDLFIKNELQKDKLISENANNKFNNILKGEISMDQNEQNNLNNNQDVNQVNQQQVQAQDQQQYVEQNQQQVQAQEQQYVEQNQQQPQQAQGKQKYSRKKKIVSLVASLLVIFIAGNCFAAALGYNNIFFMIRNLINHEDVFAGGKDNIFTDSDITISYEPIEVANGVFVQVNRFVAKDNQATLYLTYQQQEQHDKISQLHVSNENGNELASADVSRFNDTGYEVEYLEMPLDKNQAKSSILVLRAIDNTGMAVAELKIDLNTRTIDIISSGVASYELTKLSETELKQVLSNYVMINYFQDVVQPAGNEVASKEDYIAAFMIDMATRDYDFVHVSNVARILNEIYGRDENTPLNISNSLSNICKIDRATNKFQGRSDNDYPYGFCINVTDIKFENGIYTVTFSYCYLAEDGDMMSNKIARANIFETTLNLKLNKNALYYRYQIQDVNNITSQLVKEGYYDDVIMAEENNTYVPSTISQSQRVSQ